MSVQLIIGLGNPGAQYTQTRHNAGVWFIDALAQALGCELKLEKKFFGSIASTQLDGQALRLLVPNTYMNESGRAVGAIANFYRIDPSQILIAHDELDLPPGVVRLKNGGGLAGHNGLKDISRSLAGARDFHRSMLGPPGWGALARSLLPCSQPQDGPRLFSIDENLAHQPRID